MANHIDKKLLDLAIDYVQGAYKFEDILKKYNLLDGASKEGADTIVISCPFHADKTPSMKINTRLNVFNCFSCSAGGNIVGFLSQYNTKVLNNKTGYFDMVERLLKEDPTMQLRVGSNTLNRKEATDITGLNTMRLKKSISFNIKSKPSTYQELSKYLKNKFKGNIDVYISSLDLMENGLSPEEIYDLITSNYSSNKSNYGDIDIAGIIT